MANYVSRNDVRNMYENRICVPYCGLGELPHYLDKVGYNSGYYGWNYDVYHVSHNTCIISGYRVPSTLCNANMKYDDCIDIRRKFAGDLRRAIVPGDLDINRYKNMILRVLK